MSNSVELKDDELASNVRKVCFVLLKIFALISVLVLDFYMPNKVKEIALLLALPVGLLLNAVIPPKNTEI